MGVTVPRSKVLFELTKELAKEEGKIQFVVEVVWDLYDECVDIRGFNSKNISCMKGVDENYFHIIEQIKERVWDVFTNIDPAFYPPCYYPKLVRGLYVSFVVYHNKHKYQTPILTSPSK